MAEARWPRSRCIVAKRLELPYRPGERMMQKFKLWQTVDCVVGGIYYKPNTKSVKSANGLVR